MLPTLQIMPPVLAGIKIFCLSAQLTSQQAMKSFDEFQQLSVPAPNGKDLPWKSGHAHHKGRLSFSAVRPPAAPVIRKALNCVKYAEYLNFIMMDARRKTTACLSWKNRNWKRTSCLVWYGRNTFFLMSKTCKAGWMAIRWSTTLFKVKILILSLASKSFSLLLALLPNKQNLHLKQQQVLPRKGTL